MTEAEWLTCDKVWSYWTATQGAAAPRWARLFGTVVEVRDAARPPLHTLSFRKVRLFGVACCRRAAPRLPPRFLELLAETEWRSDVANDLGGFHDLSDRGRDELGRLEAEEREDYRPGVLTAAEQVVFLAAPGIAAVGLGVNLCNNLVCSAEEVVRAGEEDGTRTPAAEAAGRAEEVALCAIFRDVFGNPFREAGVDPTWLTSDVVALARGIYDGRAFDRMPILADALQEAGCADEHLLGHCRGPGPHVRGCWVVDLLLGKV